MKIFLLLILTALSGCAARSSLKPVNPNAVLVGHSNPVCMLKGPLPSGVGYAEVGEIRSSKKSYGSVNELLPLMAADARAAGADAVVNLAANQRMGFVPWGVTRPKGIGMAVKLVDRASFDCVANGGELR